MASTTGIDARGLRLRTAQSTLRVTMVRVRPSGGAQQGRVGEVEAAGDGAGHLVAEGALQHAGQAQDGQGLVRGAAECAV